MTKLCKQFKRQILLGNQNTRRTTRRSNYNSGETNSLGLSRPKKIIDRKTIRKSCVRTLTCVCQ